MVRVGRDLAVGLIGGCIVGLVAAYSGHSLKVSLWVALAGGVLLFVLAAIVERHRPADRRRQAAKDTVAAWIGHGFNLRTSGTTDTQVLQWTSRLCDLVGAIYGDAERKAFMTHIPGYAGPKDAAQREEWISRCNAALGDLVRRTDSLPVDSTFSPEDWQP